MKAVIIGASAGGVEALTKVFMSLPASFPIPVIAILHIGESQFIPDAFSGGSLKVKEASEKETPEPGNIYFAPANYHLLFETDGTFSLSNEDKVNFARPSIDVSFESFSYVLKKNLLGILLTGANHDGAYGLHCIRLRGGRTFVQNPEEAPHKEMPKAAIDLDLHHRVLDLKGIIEVLGSLV